jgi:hypothetical protein
MLTHSEAFALDDIKLSQDANIIDVLSRPLVESVSYENGRLVLKGKIEYQIIYFYDQEYLSKDLCSPFRYETDCKNQSGNDAQLEWYIESSALHCRARNDNEKLHLDTELTFSTLLRAEESVNYLSCLELSSPYERTRGEIILCYPDKDDTLWSISKQYGKSAKKLSEKNNIKNDLDISKKKFLVI